MSKRVTQSYAPEFRAEAIKLVLEPGFSVVEAAARLNMNQGTLAYWVTQARKADKNQPRHGRSAQRVRSDGRGSATA